MEELKKIVPKVLLLLVLLAGMNLLYERLLLPGDIEAYSESAALTLAVQDSSEILYLGESSNVTIADEDVEKLSISQFLGEYFPTVRLGTISKGALHAGNYYDMLRSIPKGSPVKAVVVTMNLRSFNAGWIHSKLETALQKEMVLLKPGPALWRRLMLSLRNYEIKSVEQRLNDAKAQWAKDGLHFPYPAPFHNVAEWDSAFAQLHYKVYDTVLSKQDHANIDLACQYVKTFAFQIDTATNPRIHDFDRIVALSKDRGWKLILNLLPENLEQADRMVGKDLTFLMRENRDLLVARYGHLDNVIVVDRMEALSNAEFIDQNWTTEHYRENGRKTVAEGIASALKPIFPDAFKVPVDDNRIAKGNFFNDCEGGEVWSQMQTLDATHAHSGRSASLTGPEKGQFGLSFTYPIARLDSNKLDSLAFDCWVFPSELGGNVAIAWEAGGEKTGYLWDSLQLRPQLLEANQWQQIHFRVTLWPNFREAEVVKVYPYNPSTVPIWFDDMHISFVGRK
jgi:hypothetical protein